MSKYTIHSVVDMLELDEEQFVRMVPDLIAWWLAAKLLHNIDGVKNTGFVWVDDGIMGINFLEATDPVTGEVDRYYPRES